MHASEIVEYCTEEVWRQGHNIEELDGVERVGWMLDGWAYALRNAPIAPLALADICSIGGMVERHKNKHGFRTCDVWVGVRGCPPWERVVPALEELMTLQGKLSPLEFYRAYEEVHPFVDGNGRSGKIILNWLNGTLLKPIFPPSNFWGRPIYNP